MFRILLLSIVMHLLSACGSHTSGSLQSDKAYYQLQVIPAGGYRALFFHFQLDENNDVEEVAKVKINGIEVPFKASKTEESVIEIYLLEQDSKATAGQPEPGKNYPELFKTTQYSATIFTKNQELNYSDIPKLDNQTLPQ